jgi:hypothetical protein
MSRCAKNISLAVEAALALLAFLVGGCFIPVFAKVDRRRRPRKKILS